ncbi:2Fe-2S ferredoxin [Mycobacterium vulneris]|uniref:2Fe-2S iron-sulfur cluster binding domain-containing protein n=2 Tax=Mycolicibacterium septicum TaxID=98668 RepID=A0A7X6MU06_9MYCO|nr:MULTISPECIES: 2Fe-2S iron-sulfur cluster-binding protein [Mycolicibacterium]MBX8685913.1 2Fe-2S iron-sulfur cluster binding domain-containing protein [Mycobacterium sp. 20091114027_K0903767]MCP3811264.1 2Fe-2S iron-sulfur cluster-binding protein [Mycobacteriaceae bacterium Msp059]OCB47888.1 2Fe-2S ferredoxin [Mycolicibacterium vulneris]NKZ14910.1 2Fe-2S iron-sulfur cluster binding domain-containing protein [Mycolicibacterium septicum DSM 44393]OBK07185.1 2Fe-2S ferredoxin [Mycolicibacterium
MPIITYVSHDGTERRVTVDSGVTLMDAAVDNNVPGIDGDCGGECACATCHIHVASDWVDRLPTASEQERSMLEFCEGLDSCSRLGCQIPVDDDLDGITVTTPIAQH